MKYHLCVVWDTRDTHDAYEEVALAKEACQKLSYQPDVAAAVVVDDNFCIHACYARNPK